MGNKGGLNQKTYQTPTHKEVVKNLFSDGSNGKVSWHTYTKEGFSFDKIQGCFLSNELVDALPLHRLRLGKGILK